MDASVASLQNAINRFAAVGGFPRVAVDGLWGQKTKNGVVSSLSFIGQGKCYRTLCPIESAMDTAATLITTWNESVGTARSMAEFLTGVANQLGLPHVATPITTPGGPAPIVLVPSTSVSLFERFRAMPTWQQLFLGAASALLLIFVANRFKR